MPNAKKALVVPELTDPVDVRVDVLPPRAKRRGVVRTDLLDIVKQEPRPCGGAAPPSDGSSDPGKMNCWIQSGVRR